MYIYIESMFAPNRFSMFLSDLKSKITHNKKDRIIFLRECAISISLNIVARQFKHNLNVQHILFVLKVK